MRRLSHISVIETIDLIECYILMTIQAKHPHEICILLITSEEFHLPIS